MILPPKIQTGDIVRMEDRTLSRWREQDILKQVMHGEDTWEDNESRRLSFNMCDSGKAEDVTELYRFEKTDNGCQYRLIWHRAPKGEPSAWRFCKIEERE